MTCRCIYNLLKQFDEAKQSITSIDGIFDARIEEIRTSIIDQSTALIYQTEYEVIGRKSREILWFKGYYDLISLAKRFWKKHSHQDKLAEEQIGNLIIEGISHFKSIIVHLERKFALDLRNVVDFSFLDTYEQNLYTATANQNETCDNEHRTLDEVTKYAMETIHALLISLGDLHRYFIDFDFSMPKISKDFAANYYFEAFKLNPKTGMAHNQLGTLLSGSNYDLDSIYHYLYSLVCPVPFDLSDSRATHLFQNNAKYLEQIDNEKCDAISLRDFIARYLLIADVFFNDKEINDFNGLCHCTLLDFRKMLQSGRAELSSDVLYKMIAILFFCLVKLKTIGSAKLHSLNALLVALCAEFVSACTMKLNKWVASHESQNIKFQHRYVKHFEEFERNVRNARDKHKRYIESSNDNGVAHNDTDQLVVKHEKQSNGKLSGDSMPEHVGNGKSMLSSGNSDLIVSSSGRERESDAGKSATPLSSQTKHKKRQTNLRRRRRRMISENSNSDLSYFEDSASECEMDTDFSSDMESGDENEDSWCSSDSDEEDKETNEVCTFYSINYLKMSSFNIFLQFFDWQAQNATPEKQTTISKQVASDDNDDDVIIEEEKVIYLNNGDVVAEQPAFKGLNQCEDSVFAGFMNSLNKLSMCGDENDSERSNFSNAVSNGHAANGDAEENNADKAPEKLRYKQKYNKTDPNIIAEFFQYENTMPALKLLFDWLRANNDILVNCFTTNPEFIDKIFDLLNHMNIDIFTRKVYFERKFLETENVRENLRGLFDIRQTVPLKENVLLKEFSVFDQTQRHMDWTIPLKMKITESEETIIRVFMFIDFGFSLSKMKKFNYNFCSRSRIFIKMENSKRAINKRPRKRGRRNKRRQRNRSKNRNVLNRFERNEQSTSVPVTASSNDEVEQPAEEVKRSGLKKGYLKNRQQQNHTASATTTPTDTVATTSDAKNGHAENKHELMGKLWLQHEIEVLEAKMSKHHVHLTPYLIVDAKVLANHLSIIKNLVKSKKFVVLIPKAGKFN